MIKTKEIIIIITFEQMSVRDQAIYKITIRTPVRAAIIKFLRQHF